MKNCSVMIMFPTSAILIIFCCVALLYVRFAIELLVHCEWSIVKACLIIHHSQMTIDENDDKRTNP